MSADRVASNVARWAGSFTNRVVRVWRVLPHERRRAAYASLGLFVTLFLPWYQETVVVPGPSGKAPAAASTSLTGWAAFSFVEAALLLVAVGVLTLLFQRGEGRAFHLPGGDGWVITAAGAWACLLVVWRIFDKQSTSIHGVGASISGIEWGIFLALLAAGLLTYSGSRIRAAHRPEPPLPGEDGGPVQPAPPAPAGERPPGWLTARPQHLGTDNEAPSGNETAVVDRRAPAPDSGAPPARSRFPTPVPAPGSEPATERATEPRGVERANKPLPRPSTPAARRREHPDDQLTIPLEPAD